MATIATIPALALPGHPVQLVFTAEHSGNFVKVWCTSAPQGSGLRKTLDDTRAGRVLVVSESDIDKRPEYTFDVGGSYVLEIEEFQKGAEAYGGRYRNDPDGFRTEDILSTPTTQTIYVASLLEQEIGAQHDTATLRLYVNNLTIVQTTQTQHGISTPAIAKPSSPKAKAAMDALAVQAALADLPTHAATSVIGLVYTYVNNWIAQFNSHIADTTFHANADSNNAVAYSFRYPNNVQALARSLAECRRCFLNHIQNVDPSASDPKPGSADYHEISGNNRVDWDAILLASGGSTMGACVVSLSDLGRAYTAHQPSAVHITPDTDWLLDTWPRLYLLHEAFLTELSALLPTAPSNEHPAKVTLVSGAGFKEA